MSAIMDDQTLMALPSSIALIKAFLKTQAGQEPIGDVMER